jgi:hypothetical protein
LRGIVIKCSVSHSAAVFLTEKGPAVSSAKRAKNNEGALVDIFAGANSLVSELFAYDAQEPNVNRNS